MRNEKNENCGTNRQTQAQREREGDRQTDRDTQSNTENHKERLKFTDTESLFCNQNDPACQGKSFEFFLFPVWFPGKAFFPENKNEYRKLISIVVYGGCNHESKQQIH